MMEHSEDSLRHGYTQVRRVLAAIAFANGDIDDQERFVIASSIGGASHLQSDDIRLLLKDVETKPAIETLVAEIDEPIFLRQLFIDLAVLAILKTDWHEDERAAVRQAVEAMNIDATQQARFAQAFDLLRDVSKDLDEEAG